MTFEQLIDMRVAARHATRGEWRAFSRLRRRRARGLPTLDVALAGPLVVGEFQRAARVWWRRNGPALEALARIARQAQAEEAQ